MLSISEISKSYGGRTLFEDVTLQVNREDRIGLVGPNGAGKSTLFSLVLQNESPDSGSIVLEKNMTLGHLPQETAPAGEGDRFGNGHRHHPGSGGVAKAFQQGAQIVHSLVRTVGERAYKNRFQLVDLNGQALSSERRAQVCSAVQAALALRPVERPSE